MTYEATEAPASRRPLRLWPGVVAVVLQWLVRFVVPIVVPGAVAFSVIGGLVGGLLVLVWWLFLSRAVWIERIGVVVLMAVAMFATSRIVDNSIATGAMGMLFPILAIPGLSLALVLWAVLSQHFSTRTRYATMAASILVACGVWTLVRTGGFTGEFKNDLHWRWTPTPEERLLSQSAAEPLTPRVAPETATLPAKPLIKPDTATPKSKKEIPVKPGAPPATRTTTQTSVEWDGFRGPHRDGAIPGVRIETDWTVSPPVEIWRRPIGPGWSSFAVRDDLVYTQEQRGPDEIVACYRFTTGQPVWTHRDAARFWESNAGAGPRSTPTLGKGRVYTLGATGVLNALNATNGAVVWSRNAASDANAKVPVWGFSSSPLLLDDIVVVALGGQLVAYDLATGSPRWFGPRGDGGYSSPHLFTRDGVRQILFLNGSGAVGVAPADGKVLWEHSWPGVPIVQPALTGDGDVLINAGDKSGIRRLAVAPAPDGWHVAERWTSAGLKPYFNDFVVHDGHAFGFDGSILSCIDLKDGQRKWKGGRYGHGQLVVVADQNMLLVLSEDGELALVRAVPDRYTEVARFPAIQGKTWNHPVLVGGVLLARNGEEMAAFRLSRAVR
jgi:outer membrane protein assembly factor BamB